MSKPRRQTYTMSQYLENVREGYISNDADTQRTPAWKPIVDGLAVTILTDDYVPALILAEEENGQAHIVDGGSRTFAFLMIRYGNHKIKKSTEDSIIGYKSMSKDENGNITWKEESFDIRNKTYDQFPKELQKKFNEFQIETVIHENCDKETISKLIKRYNDHSSMSASQKAFTYIGKYARDVKNVLNNDFFIECGSYKETERTNGVMERVVLESVMAIFHLDKWKSNSKPVASFLNDNSSSNEFETLNGYLTRLKAAVGNEFQDIFNSKNSFLWFTLFDKFNSLNIEDKQFVEFLRVFKDELSTKKVNEVSFDDLDKKSNTKDKKLVIQKINLLSYLLGEFISEQKEKLSNNTVSLVKEVVCESCTDEDIDFYKSLLEDYTVEVSEESPLLEIENTPSLIAMVGRACEDEKDDSLPKWFVRFFANNNTYIKDQKENYLHMKKDFDNFVRAKECV